MKDAHSIDDATVVFSPKPALMTLLNIKIDSIYNFLVYAIVLVAPIIVYGVLIFNHSLRINRLFVVLVIPVLILKVIHSPSVVVRDRFFIFGVLPYLIYATLSATWSPNVATGTVFQRLGGLYEIVIVYLIFIVADFNYAKFIKFVKFYVASAIFPQLVGAWQFANNIFDFSAVEVPFNSLIIASKYNEIKAGRYFVAGEGFSRLSGSFAEPTIYGCYLTSVLLLSFTLKLENKFYRNLLKIFQASLFFFMMMTLAKVAIITFFVGMIAILVNNKKYIRHLLLFILLIILIPFGLYFFGKLSVMSRLITETGHLQLLFKTFAAMQNSNLLIGEGIGSIPDGSWHRFLLSRIYESGLVGLYFTIAVTILPIQFQIRKIVETQQAQSTKSILIGVLIALIFGLHLYDYFIHFFPWIVIGGLMSFYNHKPVTLSRNC